MKNPLAPLALVALLAKPAPAQTSEPPATPPQQQRTVMAVPTHPVLRRDTAIQVDGSLHEWPAHMPALVLDDPRQLSGTAHKHWRGASDLSARGGMLWDAERLYLWLLVIDDWGRPMPTRQVPDAPLLPPGDSVVLYFDPRRDTRSYGPDPGRADDREFWIGMDESGRSHIAACQRRFATATFDHAARAVVLYNREKRVWTIEASIPWCELELTPEQGSAIDFTVILNDYDEPTDLLPQTRVGWTFGTGPSIDPALYGTLVLAGATWEDSKPPEAPRRPSNDLPPLLPGKFWFDLVRQVRELPLVAGSAGLEGRRGEVLATLDEQLAGYPLIDHQEQWICLQREMPREVDGYSRQHAATFVRHLAEDVLRELEQPWPQATPGVLALPGRGFLVRSKQGSIAIGPAGLGAQSLAPHVAAVFYARANDVFDRCDPLTLQMLARKKRVLRHLSFHLPGLGPVATEDLVSPGDTLMLGEAIAARILGSKDERGRVTATAGLQLTWPDGFVLVYPSLAGAADQVRLPAGKTSVDVLVLDPDHPQAEDLLAKLAPRRVVLEGFFDLPRWPPGQMPRCHRLSTAKPLLEQWTKPDREVVLLAPGQTLR
jgi:hypothetical protein